MRRRFIAGNWKMNKTASEAAQLAREILERLQPVGDGVEVAVFPPFTALHAVGQVLQGTGIKWGAQNVHAEPSGAFTGEVSVPMLVDLGCDYVILGHSERRQYFGETDAEVNRKAKAALAGGLGVIICVGETWEERDSGRTEEVVTTQVRESLAGLESDDPEKIVIAYEPVWAIGTGKTATGEEANRVIGIIRKTIADVLGEAQAAATRIQYGGSVKPDNIREFLEQPEIDGALVGGASLTADSFYDLVKG